MEIEEKEGAAVRDTFSLGWIVVAWSMQCCYCYCLLRRNQAIETEIENRINLTLHVVISFFAQERQKGVQYSR